MADIRRPSGRQNAQSGRAAPRSSGRQAAATSASNPQMAPAPAPAAGPRPSARAQAPPAAPAPAPAARPSVRAPAAAPAHEGGLVQGPAQPRPSARTQAPSPSGRAAAQQPTHQHIQPAGNQVLELDGGRASSARMAARTSSRTSSRSGSHKKVRSGPELLIAAAVLGGLGVLAVVMYFVKQNQVRDVESKLEQRVEVLNRNWKMAQEKFQTAYNTGLTFVMGKEEVSEDILKAPFLGDDKIYNVIFIRNYKDNKNKDKTQVVTIDQGRMRIEKMGNPSKEDGDLKMNYALAEGRTLPIVVAERFIKPEKDDKANMGGTITIIVKAEKDHNFEKAMSGPAPKEPEKK